MAEKKLEMDLIAKHPLHSSGSQSVKLSKNRTDFASVVDFPADLDRCPGKRVRLNPIETGKNAAFYQNTATV